MQDLLDELAGDPNSDGSGDDGDDDIKSYRKHFPPWSAADRTCRDIASS